MARKLEGKVAVITGGTGGIGLAAGERFAAEGTHGCITGRHRVELDAAVAVIGRNAAGPHGSWSDLDCIDALKKPEAAQINVLCSSGNDSSGLPLGTITEKRSVRHIWAAM